jgi:transcriptional regulator with XRE-family HTH domain
MAESGMKRGPGRRRPEDIDRRVGARMRERRIMLGLTPRQMVALIGVTLQQAYKYESGINRVSSERLYYIARVLDVDVGYFFEGIGRDDALRPTQQQLLLELARSFIAIPDRRHKDEIVSLARALAEPDAGPLAVRDSRQRIGALDEHEHHQRRRRGDFL